MLSKNQLEIINLYRKNIFSEFTILQIKNTLEKRSYQRVYEAVKRLEKEKIISITKVGNSSVIKLIFSPQSINLLSYLELYDAFVSKIPYLSKILEFQQFNDDILIITGSYAQRTKKKKLDIDLAIISKEDVFAKQKLIENLTLSFYPPLHPVSFTYKDFIEMLLSKEQNFGKEIFKKHLIIRNAGKFFELIKEAKERGFKG